MFALFQHSEHLTAAASLFYECCATSGTSAAAQTDTLEALAVACHLIGAPVNTRLHVCSSCHTLMRMHFFLARKYIWLSL